MLIKVNPQAWAANARRAEAGARDVDREVSAAIDQVNDATRQWQEAVAQRDRCIAQLEDKLAIEKAHAAGLGAEVVAYREQHPDSPLHADSGRHFKGGGMKRRIRQVYEAAFDATLRKLAPRIINPASRRAD